MADEDRQPPQAYDTVAPAGVGATTTNQMFPRAFQDLYLTGDQGLLDVDMEEMPPMPSRSFCQIFPPPVPSQVGPMWMVRPLYRPLPPLG